MSIFSLSGLFITFTALILIVILLLYGKTKLHRVWTLFNLAVFTWGIGCFLAGKAQSIPAASLGWKVAISGGLFIAVFFYHTVFIFTEIKESKILIVVYAQAIIYFLLTILSGITLSGWHKMFDSLFYPSGTIAYILMISSWTTVVFLGHRELVIYLNDTKGVKHAKARYLLIAFLVGFLGGGPTLLPALGLKIYPFGNFGVALYSFIGTYAILRHHLLDIKVAATRAGIFAVVYTAILIVLLSVVKYAQAPFQQLLGQNWWIAILGIGMALATIGPFIYQKLRERAEGAILKEQKQYQEALLEISHTMILIKDLDRLLKTIVLKVVDIVQVSWAGVYLKDEKAGKYLLKHQRAAKGEVNLPKELPMDSVLVNHLYAKKAPLTGEDMDVSVSHIGLAVPCFLDSNMVGFLLLGDKPRHSMYTQDDENVFTVLSNQTALAIENCHFYAQEREHHHLLRIAALDRQIADMAHEIDNPNQALLGCLYNLELTLDELAANIPQDKMAHLKEKISKSRFHTMRISKMITAVREFSKPTTGELVPVNLQWILDDLTTIMQPQIKHEGVTFYQEVPKEPVWLRANKVEIEQVLVNLGTNSVQAIKEVVTAEMNAQGWEKKISLRAYRVNNDTMRIDFSDTGSGIEKKLIEDIFLDFVTTKASTTGTGLGLAISRKIINKHNGRIWAESEGKYKGATFHIELPIPKDITDEDIKKADEERGNKTRGVSWNT